MPFLTLFVNIFCMSKNQLAFFFHSMRLNFLSINTHIPAFWISADFNSFSDFSFLFFSYFVRFFGHIYSYLPVISSYFCCGRLIGNTLNKHQTHSFCFDPAFFCIFLLFSQLDRHQFSSSSPWFWLCIILHSYKNSTVNRLLNIDIDIQNCQSSANLFIYFIFFHPFLFLLFSSIFFYSPVLCFFQFLSVLYFYLNPSKKKELKKKKKTETKRLKIGLYIIIIIIIIIFFSCPKPIQL